MKLVVWNSQGAKWDTAYTSFTAPFFGAAVVDDVVLLQVEAGWAPWVSSGDVHLNAPYTMDSSKSWFNAFGSAASAFCNGVDQQRRNKAVWVPWVANLEAMKTNSRCSIGGGFFPNGSQNSYQLVDMNSFELQGFTRPVIRMMFGKGGREVNVAFTILLVHMISGVQWLAEQQLVWVMNTLQKAIPQGTSAIIVGDMNVNLLSAGRMNNLPANWSIVNTGVPTQQSGGELDYGLLYDPNSQLGRSAAAIVQQFKTGNNGSDHSVLAYNIPLS
jgi:hypothetical protein